MASVSVSLNGKNISVSQNSVSVSANKDRVTWTSSDGNFQISFVSGIHPANPRTTQNGSVWEATSGPFATPTTIKYDVSADGYTTLDPEIQVIP
jgi:hypothetical protein